MSSQIRSDGGHLTSNTAVAPHFTDPKGLEVLLKLIFIFWKDLPPDQANQGMQGKSSNTC